MPLPRLLPPLVAVLAVVSWPATADAQLFGEIVVTGLERPVGFVQDPLVPDTFLVVEQGGRVRVVQGGAVAGDFLNLTADVTSDGERGLLGLAFAPDASGGWVFVNFTNRSGDTVVARFQRDQQNPTRADPTTRFDLVWPDGGAAIEQPFANHNGGHLAFGPDGYLYIGLGDGGSGNDPTHRAQDPESLLGKMLRIDVDVAATHPRGYVVPPDNPFVGRGGVLGEIWSFGLRNPWRYSFDPPAGGGTGALIIGDVGQGRWEEVDYQPAGRGGRNYGWRNREGPAENVTSLPPFSQPFTEPIHWYGRSEGASVSGGVVYRGRRLGAAFAGRYFFGDFISGRVWSLGLSVDPGTGEAVVVDRLEHTAELGLAAASPVSFSLDADGEIYIVSYMGAVHRIATTAVPEPPGPAPADPMPPANCPAVDPFLKRGGGLCVDGIWQPPLERRGDPRKRGLPGGPDLR